MRRPLSALTSAKWVVCQADVRQRWKIDKRLSQIFSRDVESSYLQRNITLKRMGEEKKKKKPELKKNHLLYLKNKYYIYNRWGEIGRLRFPFSTVKEKTKMQIKNN
eukprot:GEMP01101113.1.p1 GENE.GEMP01101113.1~~GEMP01101113.1.p1  ORF type:complete len:106 (-),score=2.52 GEMP01101113.1:308-625(-)